MQIKFLVLMAFLSMNLAQANDEQAVIESQDTQEAVVADEKKPSPEKEAVIKSEQHEEIHAKSAKQEDKKELQVKAEDKKDLDSIEAEAAKLEKLAKKKEQEAKKLREKAESLAKKSEKVSSKSVEIKEKSEKVEQDSQKLAESSKISAEEAKKLSDEVAASPDNAKRELVIRQMCLKRINNNGLLSKISKLNVLDKKSDDKKEEDKKLEACIADYKKSDLDDKVDMKRAYIGKQCTFNPGISIECPEGIYKFEGNNGLASVDGTERNEQKEVGEEKEAKDISASASQK